MIMNRANLEMKPTEVESVNFNCMTGVGVTNTWTPFLFTADFGNSRVKTKKVKHFTGQVKRKVKHLRIKKVFLSNFIKKETLVINMIPGF